VLENDVMVVDNSYDVGLTIPQCCIMT